MKNFLMSLMIVGVFVIGGCSDSKSNGDPNAASFVGNWAPEKPTEDNDDQTVGVKVTSEGKVYDLTLDESKKDMIVGSVNAGTFVASQEYIDDMNSKNPGVKIQSITSSVRLEGESRLVMFNTKWVGTYQGKDINSIMDSSESKEEVYRKISDDEATELLAKLEKQISDGAEVIKNLIGSTWELVTLFSSIDYLDSDEDDYESLQKAENIENSFTYEGVTYFKFKKIKFESESVLDINDGELKSDYEYSPLNGLQAVDQIGGNSDYKMNFGLITVEGDEMKIELNQEITISEFDTEKDKTERKAREVKRRIYRRVQ